jgi:hypothetical protein
MQSLTAITSCCIMSPWLVHFSASLCFTHGHHRNKNPPHPHSIDQDSSSVTVLKDLVVTFISLSAQPIAIKSPGPPSAPLVSTFHLHASKYSAIRAAMHGCASVSLQEQTMLVWPQRRQIGTFSGFARYGQVVRCVLTGSGSGMSRYQSPSSIQQTSPFGGTIIVSLLWRHPLLS